MSVQLGFYRSKYKDLHWGKMTQTLCIADSVLIISYDSRIPNDNGQYILCPKGRGYSKGCQKLEPLLTQVPRAVGSGMPSVHGESWRECRGGHRAFVYCSPCTSCPSPCSRTQGTTRGLRPCPRVLWPLVGFSPCEAPAGAQRTRESEAWSLFSFPPWATALGW